MKYIYKKEKSLAIKHVSCELVSQLGVDNARQLVLVSGGSNIEVLEYIANNCERLDLSRSTFGLVDERYGVADHVDSNYRQIREIGFWDWVIDNGGKVLSPVLGQSLLVSAMSMDMIYKASIDGADSVIGLFGIGSDGHTGGVIPLKSSKQFKQIFRVDDVVIGYRLGGLNEPVEEAKHRERLTISISAIEQFVDYAIIYAWGENKRKAIKSVLEGAEVEKVPGAVLGRKPGVLVSNVRLD